MSSCSMYTVGLALILVAVGYQYRDDITTMLGAWRGRGQQKSPRPTLQPLPVKQREFTEEDILRMKKESEWKKPPKEPDSSEPKPYNPPFDPDHPQEHFSEAGTRLITANELAAHSYKGPLKPVWLAIMGRVYDVSKGKSYGEEGGYNFFTGIDGTRAFVTGEFNEEGLVETIDGLTPLEVGEIDRWTKFYDTDYTFVGKLIGRYYQRDGSPTAAWQAYQAALGEEEKIKALQQEQARQFPPCNSQWTQQKGGHVYCSEKSGGIQRSWAGVPRRYFAPGSRQWRCACINTPDLGSPHVKPYPDCPPEAIRCDVNKEKLAKLEE